MKLKIAALVFTFMLILCSCTVQTDFDIFDLCERFNKLSEENILSTDSFISDEQGGLYCFMTAGESKVLVSVKTDEKTAVRSVYVTVERNNYLSEDRAEIIRLSELIFAAYNYGDSRTAKEKLSSVGFDKDFEPFSTCFNTEADKKYAYTLYSNEYAFTLCGEKNKAD